MICQPILQPSPGDAKIVRRLVDGQSSAHWPSFDDSGDDRSKIFNPLFVIPQRLHPAAIKQKPGLLLLIACARTYV